MKFFYFNNSKGVKNLIIDSKKINHQVDLLNEILSQQFSGCKNFNKDDESYTWVQLKDYLGDLFYFENGGQISEINVVKSGYLDIIKSFTGNYTYENIIEMFKIIVGEYECGLGTSAIPVSLNFYIFENPIDLKKLKKAILTKTDIEFYEKFVEE